MANLSEHDVIDFLTLDGEAPAETPAPAETLPDPAQQPASAETVLVPAQPAPAAPVVPPGHVPLDSLLSEREKRQAAERQLQEFQRKQPAAPAPNLTTDPQGWQAAQEQRLEKAELDMRMNFSGRFAAQHHGADKVEAAKSWGLEQSKVDPYFSQKFIAQHDPYGWLLEQHQRDQALGLLGGKKPEDWAIEYAASLGYAKPVEATPETQQQPAPANVAASPVAQRPAPPRSIASAPPAGGVQQQPVIGDEDLLGGIFK